MEPERHFCEYCGGVFFGPLNKMVDHVFERHPEEVESLLLRTHIAISGLNTKPDQERIRLH